MNAVVPHRAIGLARNDARRIALFTKTAGKDLVGSEIDEAIEWCEHYRANPFVKDIYFFVFDADKPAERRVVPVLGIGHYRKTAARSGNYRPDDQPPRFAYDDAAKSPANPAGMLWCEVGAYQFAHGAWHRISERLKWEERAPIIAGGFDWEDIPGQFWPAKNGKPAQPKRRKVDNPNKPDSLDPKKKNWQMMPETMMAKCVEAALLRKAWPEDLSGSYVSEELDAANTIELTATEIAQEHDAADRMKRLGIANSILIDWCDGGELQQVPIGSLGVQAIDFIRANREEPSAVLVWQQRNRHGLTEYWARDKDGALAVKAEIEKVVNAMQQEAAE